MKKKIILAVSSIICLILITVVIISVYSINKEKEKTHLYVTNYNNVTLDLGKIKVSDYEKSAYANTVEKIEFKDDIDSFYNDIIKKNPMYDEKLDFKINRMDIMKYKAYGYMYSDMSFFRYILREDKVIIEASIGSFDVEYDTYEKTYYIPGPFNVFMSKWYLEQVNRDCYNSLQELSMDQLKILISYLPNEYYNFEDDSILLKGRVKTKDSYEISNDFLIKVELDGLTQKTYPY